MKSSFVLPIVRFSGVIVIALVIFAVAMISVLSRPVVDLPKNVELVELNGMKTITSDFIEEPDQLGSFANLQDFFDRQTQFATALKNDRVAVKFVTEQGQTVDETRDVRRTELSDLPFVFWFQNLVGLIAMLIGGWIFALRREIAVVSLLVLGVGLQISATAAAVYGSRQLAIEGDFFSTLSNLNHLGSAIFGTALVAMFMMFPRQIIRPVWLLVPVFVFGLFHLSDTFYWTAEPLFIIAIPLQLLVAIVFGVIQFRLSRNEPLDRAGLRWFSLTTFTGCLLFVALSILPGPLGLTDTTFLSQGYAFGFFSFIHIGLALGVSRFRLFALDKFAYHVWLWIGGAALIFLVDFGLLIWLRNQPWASLAIALFVSSFLYFPLRQVLINRLLTPKTASIVGKVPQVVSVGLSPTLKSRNEKWDDLLRDIFEPASDIQILEIAPEVGKLAENGLALDIPIVKEMKGRRLRYAASGRRLFNSTDLELVRTITHMHSVVVESRESYETGVTQERDRISRDVHDNIGAQLLTALHTPEESRKDEMLRDTLSDLRTIVNEGFQTEHALTDILLDIRNEIADRLELLSITLDWPVIDKVNPNNPTVSYVFANTLRSIIREITSNTIKYANADEITVRIDWTTKHLDLEMQDNGEGFDPQTVQRGNGLRNIFDRTDSVGGQCGVDSSSKGTVFKIRLPVVKIPSRQMEVTQT